MTRECAGPENKNRRSFSVDFADLQKKKEIRKKQHLTRGVRKKQHSRRAKKGLSHITLHAEFSLTSLSLQQLLG